jgi:hypothetical protein
MRAKALITGLGVAGLLSIGVVAAVQANAVTTTASSGGCSPYNPGICDSRFCSQTASFYADNNQYWFEFKGRNDFGAGWEQFHSRSGRGWGDDGFFVVNC